MADRKWWGHTKHDPCYWCGEKMMDDNSVICRASMRATRDHIFPKCVGGRKRVWCCNACNQMKGDMLPHEWALLLREILAEGYHPRDFYGKKGPRGISFYEAAKECGIPNLP